MKTPIFLLALLLGGCRAPGANLATGEQDTLPPIDTTPPHVTIQADKDGVSNLVFSSDGECLASGGGFEDNAIKLWNPQTGQLLGRLIGHRNKTNALAFSPDGKLLASGGMDGRLILWDLKSRRAYRTINNFPEFGDALAFSPDGKTVAAADKSDPKPKSWPPLNLWDARTGRLAGRIRNPDGGVASVAFLADGKRVLVGYRYSPAMVWDAATRQRVHTLTEAREVHPMELSPNGRLVALRSAREPVSLWDTRTWRRVRGIQVPRTTYVNYLSFSADGAILALSCDPGVQTEQNPFLMGVKKPAMKPGEDDALQFWKVDTGQRVRTWDDSRRVHAVFSPDGKEMAVGSLDGTIRLWKASALGIDQASGAKERGEQPQ